MSLQIQLDNFTGPLDLLLHLIRRHEMDICDIRIVEITEQYLAIINQMQQLDLDVAGEFLMMAATLLHIKSRMLLPLSDEGQEDEEEDPRAELVKRLLEYQRYKQAGQAFEQLQQLQRDIFLPRAVAEDMVVDEEEYQEVAVSIFVLTRAFHRLLHNVKPEIFHEVVREQLTVADACSRIRQQFTQRQRLSFRDLVDDKTSRIGVIVVFLAILEMIRMRLLRVDQAAGFSEIWLTREVTAEKMTDPVAGVGFFDYD